MPDIDPNAKQPIRFKDVCTKCNRCFAYKGGELCFWCLNPPPTIERMTAHKPISETEKLKKRRDPKAFKPGFDKPKKLGKVG